ncbi:MAG: ankyrin repeat domain-containing protein [Spirochaetales bacterium]|nr:ankyrin repeat domain-containing protein [Spirochaetales bacterium]
MEQDKFVWEFTAMIKRIVPYALIFLLSCAAHSQQQEAPAGESPDENGGPLIPVLYYDPQTGEPVSYVPPDIPRGILRILRENMKYENSQDRYYYIQQELSEKGLNGYRVLLAADAAIGTGNIELVQKIFKYYVNFANWRLVEIRVAAKTGSLEMVKFLLDAGVPFNDSDDYWHTDFSWFAAYCPNPDVIRFLIEYGADINKTTDYRGNSLNHAAEHGRAENLRVLLAAGASLKTFHGHSDTALMLAAKSGNDECVQILLDAGADIEAADDYGNTALMTAAASGNEKSVRLLLEAGAGKNINATNRWGSTALIEAAIKGNGETAAALIAAGADVNAGTWEGGSFANTPWYLYSKGLTALMLASTADAVKALLAGEADVNLQDSDGNNAIYYQCFFYRDAETIRALIQAGSYLYLDVNGGRDLLRLSKSWSDWEYNDEIIGMLEKAGCVDEDPDGEWREHPYFHVDRH